MVRLEVELQPYNFFNLGAIREGWLTPRSGRLTPGNTPVPMDGAGGWVGSRVEQER
jgi:hypothetical protein